MFFVIDMSKDTSKISSGAIRKKPGSLTWLAGYAVLLPLFDGGTRWSRKRTPTVEDALQLST